MRKIIVVIFLGVLAFSVEAQYEEGKHYEVVSETKTEKPTVTEFFSLFCGHCYEFEPMIGTFAKGLTAGTTFEKSHVDYIPRDNKEVSVGIVKAFLTMQALGVEKRLVPAAFDYIHAQRKPVANEADIKAIFLAYGVSSADFDKHYNSPKTAEGAKKMIALWQEKKITNVPTFVVNGKYKVHTASVSGWAELIKLVNYLLEQD